MMTLALPKNCDTTGIEWCWVCWRAIRRSFIIFMFCHSVEYIYIYIDVESLWHATRRQDGRDLLRLERNRATCIWNILERCPGRFWINVHKYPILFESSMSCFIDLICPCREAGIIRWQLRTLNQPWRHHLPVRVQDPSGPMKGWEVTNLEKR